MGVAKITLLKRQIIAVARFAAPHAQIPARLRIRAYACAPGRLAAEGRMSRIKGKPSSSLAGGGRRIIWRINREYSGDGRQARARPFVVTRAITKWPLFHVMPCRIKCLNRALRWRNKAREKSLLKRAASKPRDGSIVNGLW